MKKKKFEMSDAISPIWSSVSTTAARGPFPPKIRLLRNIYLTVVSRFEIYGRRTVPVCEAYALRLSRWSCGMHCFAGSQ